ncbi:hypothetical protein DEU56DRAFT_464700 [Suillus clintonianus]|uniref:uncharacterized protein n=1 Tax=Suillus clintonianus TaxID=1904413 RepID=UPI001B883504|nr:uncharacterized protein DEU56DRAFT_464700 [Suillus clintonianus]KAG2130691.1 hypothetical protein DEU56DRAFT_464700 [Suillus clintonianus]
MDDCAHPMGHQTIAYVEAASTAALLFDFCITFDSEVRWTWRRKWGIVRMAFVISRYMPIATFIMQLYYTVESTHGGISHPGRYIVINGTMNILGSVAADALLVARTHAFCAWGKSILIAISLFNMVIVATTLKILHDLASEPGNSIRYGVFQGEQRVSIVYGLLAIYQLVLMSLTLHKRFKFYRQENENTPLVATVYRDGVIYMLCIALTSMANCVGMVMLPLSYTFLFYCPQAVVHSVLASRILFNLRATNESQDIVVNGPAALGMFIAQPIQTPSGVDYLELRDFTDL